MSEFAFNSICRLCVQICEKEKVSPIFNNKTYDETVSLSERIRYCSSIEVAEDDGLPPQICNTCLLKLNESFVFRNQCVLADITLKRLKNFGFDVNEIPNLSKIDIENQIVKSENDDCMYKIHSSDAFSTAGKFKENIDEFDNSKNGRHRRNIHKLKSLSFQKKNTLHRKPDECSEDLATSNNLVTNLCLPKIFNYQKEDEKELGTISENSGSERKFQKHKKIKQFLKTKKTCFQDSRKQDVINRSENFQNVEEDCGEGSVRSKCLVQKGGKKKRFSFSKEKPTSFKCDYCEKVYPSEGGWRYHVHTMHNENYQPFICDLCGQAFKVKKNLEAHKNSIHFHLKLHLCDLCGRGFASKYSLKVHKSWHNDEKNYTCDICGTKFRTRGKMNTHRSIHGGPKKFMCHICSRDFRWKKDFEIHMRTHTGEKPFKCSYCGKAFSSLTNMKKHEKNHLKKINVEKTNLMYLSSEEKTRKSEVSVLKYESEDVRNQNGNQVSETALYVVCK